MRSDTSAIDAMRDRFSSENPHVEIAKDGALDPQAYCNARLKILWVLKQDYDPSGKESEGESYADRIRDNGVSGSPTWRRMAFVSHGLITGDRRCCEELDAEACKDYLLMTAVIQLNKDQGDSRTSPQMVIDGYSRFKDLIGLQIDLLEPDVIIVCLPDIDGLRSIVNSLYLHCHKRDFCHGPENVIIKGANVGIGEQIKPLFLWPYHPQATKGDKGKGISDCSYTLSLLRAYDSAVQKWAVT